MEKNLNNSVDLKDAESKMEILGRMFEHANAQALSIVQFTLQLKELKEQIDTIMKSLIEKTEEVGLKERLLEERAKEIEAKECELGLFEQRVEEFKVEIDRKKEKLGSFEGRLEKCNIDFERKVEDLKIIQKKIEECRFECKSKETELISVRKLVEDCCEKLYMKIKEMGDVEKSIEEHSMKLESKKEELGLKQREVEECCARVKMEEEKSRELKILIESKKKCLDELERKIETCNRDILRKEEELSEKQKSLEECCSELDSVEVEFDTVRNFVNEKKGVLELKEKRLKWLSEEIELKEKKLRGLRDAIDESVKELVKQESHRDSIRVLIDEFSEELEVKEREYEEKKKSVEDCEKALEGKRQEIEAAEKAVEAKKKETGAAEKALEVKEKEIEASEKCIKGNSVKLLSKEEKLRSLQKECEVHSRGMETRERDFQELVKEKEELVVSLKRSLDERLQNLEVREKQFEEHVKEFQLKEKQSSVQSCNEMNLQLFLNEHLKKHDFVINKISTILRTTTDPGRMVLNALHGFYPSNAVEGKMGSNLDIVRRSCILLLDLLFNDSPDISPAVQDEALKLAHEWKTKMRVAAENSLEVLGFLQLLAAFKLGSYFKTNELTHLLDTIAQYKQEPVLRRALAIADRASANDESLDVQVLEHGDASVNLRTSTDPAKFVLDFIIWSYLEQKKMGGSGFEGTALRSYILLLRQLKEISPKISPQVKAEAATLAVEWRNKLRSVNGKSVEVVGFLQFLGTYDLVSFFHREEILWLLKSIAHLKMAPEICWTLGFSDMVIDIVQNLFQGKHYLEAIRFYCTLKLVSKAPPEGVLREFLETARVSSYNIFQEATTNSKDKALYFEIAALGMLIEFVKNHKLDSLLPPESIQRCIVQLENAKANGGRYSAEIPKPISELQLQLRQNCDAGASRNTMFPPELVRHSSHVGTTCVPSNQMQERQRSQKRARIDSIPIRFSQPQAVPPFNPYGSGLATNGVQTQLGSECNHNLRVSNMEAGQGNDGGK